MRAGSLRPPATEKTAATDTALQDIATTTKTCITTYQRTSSTMGKAAKAVMKEKLKAESRTSDCKRSLITRRGNRASPRTLICSLPFTLTKERSSLKTVESSMTSSSRKASSTTSTLAKKAQSSPSKNSHNSNLNKTCLARHTTKSTRIQMRHQLATRPMAPSLRTFTLSSTRLA